MKKIIISLLLFAMLLPYIVNAEICDTDKITIDSITLEEKSNSVVEIEEATTKERNINLNISMTSIGDNAKYRLEVRNASNKDYELNNNGISFSSDYIDYIIESEDNSNIVKAKSTKIMYLNVQYKNQVPNDKFTNGVFKDDLLMKINLSSENLNNPITDNNYYILIIFIIFFVTILSVLFRKSKIIKIVILVISFSITIPISVYALCTCSLNINSIIEITNENKFTGVIYRHNSLKLKNGDTLSDFYMIRKPYYTYYYKTLEECNYYSNLDGSVCEKIDSLLDVEDFTMDASTLNRDWYLKHDIDNNIIKNSYVCFIDDDNEVCMKGGDGGVDFPINSQIIKDFNRNNSYCVLNPNIPFEEEISCNGSYSMYLRAKSTGYVAANLVGGQDCKVFEDGSSNC